MRYPVQNVSSCGRMEIYQGIRDTDVCLIQEVAFAHHDVILKLLVAEIYGLLTLGTLQVSLSSTVYRL